MRRLYELGLYEKALPAELSWEERLRVAGACGFDYVELSVDESDARLARLDWTPDERRELVRAMERTGVPIRSLCLSGHRMYPLGSSDASVCARSVELAERACELASDLGARTVQLAGYDVYYEPSTPDTQARFARNLERVVEAATRHGVVLGFETMETPFMDTVAKAMMYVHQIGSPYLGVYPDLGNLTNAALAYGGSVGKDIACGHGHIVAAHCKETRAGTYRDMTFGEGTTDYAGGLAALVSQGVRRFVAEFWYLGSPTWEADATQAAAFVRGKIEEALAHTDLDAPAAPMRACELAVGQCTEDGIEAAAHAGCAVAGEGGCHALS